MSIQIFNNLVSEEKCRELEIYIDDLEMHNFIGRDTYIENFFLSTIIHRISTSLKSTGIVSFNVSNSAIPFHLDDNIGEDTHKILIYLTQGAGTDFCKSTGETIYKTSGNIGTVIIFDLRLYHKGGESQQGNIKKTCGLRCIYDL